MSEEQKKVDLSGLFGQSDDVTGEQMLDNLNKSDENLSMKTDVRDPIVLTAMDMFTKVSEKKGYHRLEELLKDIVRSYRENMCSHDRKSRKELVEAWVSLMEANMRRKESLGDQIFGGSRR